MLKSIFEKEKTCRTCTKTGNDHSSVFTNQDAADGICFSEMITECTMYSIKENDDLPHLICTECKEKVRIAYGFKKQCEESHRKLLSLIESAKPAVLDLNETPSTEDVNSETNASQRKKSTRRTSTKRHHCEKCDLNFPTAEQLKVHSRKDHLERHKCPNCPKEFIRLGHLTRHLNLVHKKESPQESVGERSRSCSTTPSLKIVDADAVKPEVQIKNSVKTESSDDLDYDFGTDNDDDPSYPGDNDDSSKSVVGEADTNGQSITDSLPTKKETPTEPSDENSTPQENAESPVQSTKSSSRGVIDLNRKFQCDECHKAFKRKSHLKQHSLCHTKVKPYPCPVCQKRFGRPDNLKVHMSNHGQKQFQCNACDRSFGQAYLLKRHKDQTHCEEKPFLCSECGQRFVRNGDLAVHMRRHTGEKPYKCQYCNKGFTRSTEVYVHERYHTGEKRHVCSMCGKAFQRPYNLLVHVRTHTGERPYQCPHCPKNFAQCSDLKAHIRRHTGERYRCDQCGMGFIHVFVLNQHKLSVHGIEVPSRIKRVAKLSTDAK